MHHTDPGAIAEISTPDDEGWWEQEQNYGRPSNLSEGHERSSQHYQWPCIDIDIDFYCKAKRWHKWGDSIELTGSVLNVSISQNPIVEIMRSYDRLISTM